MNDELIDPAAADALRDQADPAARLLKTLANANRLSLLCLLAGRERTVGEMSRELGLAQSAVSQHLARLRRERLVRTRRSAQTVYYSLASGPAGRLLATLHDIYCDESVP